MSTGELSQQEIDALLNRAADRARRASEAHRAAPAGDAGRSDDAPTRVLEDSPPAAQRGVFDELLDVPLDVRIRLGEAEMTIEEVVSLRDGSVVELDRAPGDPVDVLVNDRVVARGEIVVVDDRFTVRVTELAAGREAGAGEAKHS